MNKKSVFQRLLSILLCLAMVAAYVPASIFSVVAVSPDNVTRVADPSTMNDWVRFFGDGTGNINTENAGGVWTDKSVFTDADDFSHITEDSDGNQVSISLDNEDGFLVALSAMASNMTVTGQSSVPTDTMLVLDVSGSMNGNPGNNNVAAELAEAANSTIHTLLTSNPNNRVGVVLYSGPTTVNGSASANDAVLMLPLGRYTTGTDNQYLQYGTRTEEADNRWEEDETFEVIRLDSDVRIAGTSTRPTNVSKDVVGATYIQKGVILAKDQFTAESNDPVVDGVTSKPVLVLMSDGAPTVTDTDFTNPGSYNLGTGAASSTSAAQGFVTQLSAAYAKQQIEAKYGTEALFYTVGLGVSDDEVATSVLDPANSDSAIDEFWTRYNRASAGSTVTVQGNGNNARRVTKISETLEQNYVDRYIEVDGSTTDLAQGLIDAFESIVDDIQLQSKHYPTLVGTSDELSGYVSFVDKVGSYMNVTDVKGVLIHGTLFSGACLAKNFVTGGGDLGTTDNPTALGDEMVWAVQARLGIDDVDTARTLIGLAYQYGQLSYTDPNNFSNYIGWYANAAGEFLGFWHEGSTTVPEATGNAETDPVYLVKSYGYLGETDPEHGVAESDMMYATVQVRHNIATGEELVTFAVPAALLPVTTYNVELYEDGTLKTLTQTGAQAPIRLVYEVALDESINELNLSDVVSAEYLAANTNADGTVNFYSNQYEADNATGYGTVNTYAYFNPSRQNDKYYYLNDAPVYVDNQGTQYDGTTSPADYSGTLYRSYPVYEKNGNALNIRTVYRPLSTAARATAVQDTGASTWHIPAGNVHVNMDGYHVYKGGTDTYNADNNPTGTLQWANEPFVDTANHTVDDTGYNFIVGATLGNNGKLTVTPATGIQLSKTMAEGVTDPGTPFTFTITNITNAADSSAYPAVLENADGTRADTTVQFTDGKAVVYLLAGQTIYITGMTAGTQYTVTETETDDHIVESVNGTAGTPSANVTITAGQLAEVDFINTERGKGNLIISKDVNYPEGFVPAAAHNSKEFTVEVTFTGNTSGMTVPTGTQQNGSVYTLKLKDGDSVTFGNIPQDTTYTVEEIDMSAGYSLQEYRYSDDTRVIGADDADQVHVVNAYAPTAVSPNVTIQGTKTVIGGWPANSSFTVRLWEVIDFASGNVIDTEITATVTEASPSYTLDMSSLSFPAAGTYYFRVAEDIPADAERIADMAYDRTLGLFSITVTDNDADGQLEILNESVTGYQGTPVTGNATDGFIITKDFTNVVTKDLVYLDIQKTLDGFTGTNPPLADITFGLFTSMDEQEASTPSYYTLTDGSGNATIMVPVTADSLGSEGKVYYLREIAPAVENRVVGMNYDQSWLYAIKITWDTTSNKAIVEYAPIENGAVGTYSTYDRASVTFQHTNTYTTGVESTPEIDLSGTKSMTGDTTEIGNRVFSFSVYNATAAFVPQGDPLQTVSNNGSTISFESITFDSEGIKYLVIKENATTLGGVTIDSSEYHVTVLVEKYDDNGTTKLRVADGYPTIVKYGSTGSVANDAINFTNTYTYTDTTYTISGTKNLTGRVLLNDEFTFTLTEVADAAGAALTDAKTWEAKNTVDSTYHNGTFTFDTITYTVPGTYYYLVDEVENGGSNYGISYDPATYIVAVTIEDNGEGQLVVKSVTVDGSSTKPIAYNNTYTPAKTSSAIPGTKTLEGKVLGEGTYEFELYRSDETWAQGDKIPQSQPVKNGENGSFSFDQIEYTAAGTYYYLVKEVNGGQKIDGVTYDDSVFRVKVEVTDDLLGQLHATTTVFDQYDIPQIGVEFVNTYAVEGTASLILKGDKTLLYRDGKALENDEFTFQLYTTDSTYDTTDLTPVTTTNTDGAFSFQIDYTTADLDQTFYYVLQEENAGQRIDGVTHDRAAYQLEVKVEDDGVGGLKVTVVSCSKTDADIDYLGTETTVDALDFTNTYSAKPATYTLAATKEYDGLTMRDFEFTLTGEIGTQQINETKTLDKTAKKVTFSELTFPAAGDYEFTVVEKVNSLWGFVVWDTNEYTVKIKVTDNNEGQLEIDSNNVVVTSTEGKTDLSFHNGYDLENGQVTFLVTKTMDPAGDRTDPSAFTFDLYTDLNGQPIDNATSDSSGAASFDMLTFNEDDLNGAKTATRTYYIKERLPEGFTQNPHKGITYDTTLYTVVVTLTDNEEGNILVSYTVNGNAVDESTYKFAFENKYVAADTSTTISGTKELVGGGLEPGKFTFKLYETDSTYSIAGLTPVATASNAADGSFTFDGSTVDALKYTDEDVHYYVLVEDSTDPIAETLYDTISYKLKVTVTDNGEGQLVATLTDSTGKAIDSTNPITFRNVPHDEITEKEVELVSAPGTSIDGKQVNAGDELVYTISYTNYNRTAVNVTINDTVPAYTTYVNGSAGSGVYENGVLTWNLPVDPDETVEVSFKVTVDEAEGIFSNQATVRDGVNTYTTNEVHNHTVEDELVKDVFKTGITGSIDGKQVEVGDELFYTITFHNPTDDPATLDIEDQIPEHTAYVDGSATDNAVFAEGKLVWEVLNIQPWSSKTVSFKVTVLEPNAILNNQATAFDGTNGYTSNLVSNHTVEDITQKDVALESKPEVKIDGQKVNVGDVLLYTITYRNITGKDASVTVTDKLPAYTSFVSADNGGVHADGTVTWTLDVPAWETAQVTVQVKVEGDETIYTNTATVVEGQNEYTTNPVTNHTVEEITEKDVFLTGTTTSIDGKDVELGESLTYTISYTNVTGADGKVTITDTLPAGTTFVSADKDGKHADGVVTWELDVAAWQTVTVQLTVKVTASDTTAENQATVQEGTNKYETNLVTNELYEIKDITVDITAQKTVKNTGDQKIGPEGFSFVLENVTTGEKLTGRSDKDGLAVYGLTFAESDIGKTYTYKLTEINDGKANVTYSTAIYSIAITVSESEDHKLVASIKCNGTATDKVVAAFENVYDYTPAQPENPYTGDTMNLTLWASLLLVSALGIISLPILKKRIAK